VPKYDFTCFFGAGTEQLTLMSVPTLRVLKYHFSKIFLPVKWAVKSTPHFHYIRRVGLCSGVRKRFELEVEVSSPALKNMVFYL